MLSSYKTKRLTVSAMMLAIATVLSLMCAMIPFLNALFGGGYTFGSMLCLVIVSYMYGIRWGTFTAVIYSLIQMLMGHGTVIALFTPGDESYMGSVLAALTICVIDYLLAYTALGLGGLFRNKIKRPGLSLCLGSVVALSARYVCHIVSGYIFYGTWAEWFFTQEGVYEAYGEWVLSSFTGAGLSLVYSVVYNGMYMIPEIITTAALAFVVARIPQLRKTEKPA